MESAINLVLMFLALSVSLTFLVGVVRLWRATRRMAERDRETAAAMASTLRSEERHRRP